MLQLFTVFIVPTRNSISPSFTSFPQVKVSCIERLPKLCQNVTNRVRINLANCPTQLTLNFHPFVFVFVIVSRKVTKVSNMTNTTGKSAYTKLKSKRYPHVPTSKQNLTDTGRQMTCQSVRVTFMVVENIQELFSQTLPVPGEC